MASKDTIPNMAAEDERPTRLWTPAQVLLEDLLRRSLIPREDWQSLPAEESERIRQQTEPAAMIRMLVDRRLLTAYQADRVLQGNWGSLVIGNYRVLDSLGSGGMGVVFRGEHLLMRRLAAIKVMTSTFEDHVENLTRFLGEIRALARLQHPHVVAAIDAGRVGDGRGGYYFVMEYVAGGNLEAYVKREGPLTVARACDVTCQIASALAEAHAHQIIHRDVKPSNVLLTEEGQAKLTDFGLARPFQDRGLTRPGTILGSIDYLAPEQARDSASVDQRSDIYSLGATLYWCLAGKTPFPARPTITEDLLVRQTQLPASLKPVRPDLPAGLEAVVFKMMAVRPEDRYPTAQAVIHALLTYWSSPAPLPGQAIRLPDPAVEGGEVRASVPRVRQVLVVDDNALGRARARLVLQKEGLACDEALDGETALAAIEKKPYELILLDIHLPGIDGAEVLRRLRQRPPCPNLKIVMVSGEVSPKVMANYLAAGADDYLSKSADVVQLAARVKAALAHKDAQDRSDLLTRNLLAVNAELERNLSARAGDLVQTRNGLVLALAELAELRTEHGASHLARLQRFARLLGEEASRLPAFAGQVDGTFLDTLEACAPLHDIGQVALPDHILRKAGKLDPEERLIMQTHTTLGADILERIARRYPSALGLLRMAIDIARHHHEAYDGSGYPDRLAGPTIPLAARLVALADVYDAVRSRRPYRPPLSHLLATELITQSLAPRFDPHLLEIFQRLQGEFEALYRQNAEP